MNRVIFILILVLIPNLSFSKTMTSEDFVYSKIYVCGPKKIVSYDKLVPSDLQYYYIIHFDKHKNIVVSNNRKQYQSFEPIKYSDLTYQSGGEVWLEFTEIEDNIYKMNLITKIYNKNITYKYWVQTLIFNENDLTYQRRITTKDSNEKVILTLPPSIGFCYPKFIDGVLMVN